MNHDMLNPQLSGDSAGVLAGCAAKSNQDMTSGIVTTGR
jgi:hypothetical protein